MTTSRTGSALISASIAIGLTLFLPVASAFGQPDAARDHPTAQASAPPAAIVYSNRKITELRASIQGRTPAERAAGAVARLNALVSSHTPGSVKAERIEGVMMVSVGADTVFAIVPADVDELSGETLEQKAASAVSTLQAAIDEQVELRTPARLVSSALKSLAVTLVFAAMVWMLWRGQRILATRVSNTAEQQLQKFSSGDLVRASRAPDILRRGITAGTILLGLLFTYAWLTFVLRQFPYTRPWGESLREFLLTTFAGIGLAIIRSIPDLFMIVVIVCFTRFMTRLARVVFDAAEHQHLRLPGIYPETVQPTRRMVSALLWLFAIVLSYPYLPGSESDAFKGMSVFVGLIISLGSSGVVTQVMSGLTLTYSRALQVGDFVRIGDVEGTVTHLGSLSTKIKTAAREDVTIPNAVVVSTPVTNYSHFADAEGVLAPTKVTIGYDVPWRQVHAMLLLAAARTPDIKRNPPPVVRQTDLKDFSVEYTLMVCPEAPQLRVITRGALMANIQDVFNEFGVQIMSPSYEADPHAPKVVPRDQWYAAPAVAPQARPASEIACSAETA
jgi:small-conductance mechanosensitive channel